jgi:hypothetical protein
MNGYYTRRQLKTRGWSDSMIKQWLTPHAVSRWSIEVSVDSMDGRQYFSINLVNQILDDNTDLLLRNEKLKSQRRKNKGKHVAAIGFSSTLTAIAQLEGTTKTKLAQFLDARGLREETDYGRIPSDRALIEGWARRRLVEESESVPCHYEYDWNVAKCRTLLQENLTDEDLY